VSGTYKKQKKQILDKLDELDKKEESAILGQNELYLKRALSERLAHLLRKVELKWYQRAKTKDLLEGDANTKYFHQVANGKHRKTHIFRLEQEEGLIRGDAELKSFITRYYKSLFGAPDSSYVSLDKTRTDELQLRKMRCL